MDVFDRIRHRLIRWLSCGDFIILNAEHAFGGFRAKNAGPVIVDVDAYAGGREIGVYIGQRPINVPLQLIHHRSITMSLRVERAQVGMLISNRPPEEPRSSAHSFTEGSDM